MTLINGVASESIAANDRGLQYGDGVFRTLRVAGGTALHWQRHYAKLAHDCAALDIRCPEPDLLASELARLADRQTDGVAKIIVTRGEGARGYAVTPAAPATRILSMHPVPDYPSAWAGQGVKVHLCRLRLSIQPRLAGVKHLNRLENVLARGEWNDPAIAEGLLLDSADNVIEGVMSNLFISEGETLVTPDLRHCGVAGVQRERILERAAAQGVTCRVEPISLERLLRADEAMLVNSIIELWAIREIEGRHWLPGRWSATVRRWLGGED